MLEVVIMSAQQVFYEGKATQVILPGQQGVFEVQKFHHPIVSCLLPGVIVVDEQILPIHRGIVRVEKNKLSIIVDPDFSQS